MLLLMCWKPGREWEWWHSSLPRPAATNQRAGCERLPSIAGDHTGRHHTRAHQASLTRTASQPCGEVEMMVVVVRLQNSPGRHCCQTSPVPSTTAQPSDSFIKLRRRTDCPPHTHHTIHSTLYTIVGRMTDQWPLTFRYIKPAMNSVRNNVTFWAGNGGWLDIMIMRKTGNNLSERPELLQSFPQLKWFDGEN